MMKAFGKHVAFLAQVTMMALLLLLFSGAQARAQGGGVEAPPQNEEGRGPGGPNRRDRDPLRALNLTADQLQQIRAIREESKDQWRAVRQRLGDAHRALDEAIYSDNANEAVVEERAREVGLAQAAVARLRALTELKIRRVLTFEQLNTLRTLREQAQNAQRERDNGFGQRTPRRDAFRQRDGDGPLQRRQRP